jgi:hypothetical protein
MDSKLRRTGAALALAALLGMLGACDDDGANVRELPGSESGSGSGSGSGTGAGSGTGSGTES